MAWFEYIAVESVSPIQDKDNDILDILHQLNSFPMTLSILKETHIGKTVNTLKKRKGIIGTTALQLVNSWKQLVTDVNKPKPKIVVEESRDDYEAEEPVDMYNRSRVKKSPSSLRTFNMFEGVEQPSYSQTRSRSPSPLSSTLSLSLSPETPSTSKYSPITERRSLSPQPFSGASTAKRKVPMMDSPTESVALSKRSRTQVYSGKRSGSQAVLSLFELALKVLMANINALEEVKGVPYRIMEPVLARCSPAQLQRLESFNPHFLGRGDGLWHKHCQKEFKGVHPRPGQLWRDLYMKQVEAREDRLKKISDNISARKAQQEPVRTVKMAEATRMRRRRTATPFNNTFITPSNQPKSVTPLMKKARDMAKERSMMFGKSRR
ncbi:transcription elongation factor B polypeptide 3-like isoform X2 [Dysidea avara]|uniref:transcription elongation factor B polypeptide 3-like isoform X2 n=1 Tax=Dysidea avara TaxID=196820 RepID=UPI00331FAA45